MYDYDFAKYEGLFIPTVTPFDPSGELDLKSLGRVGRGIRPPFRASRRSCPALASARARCSRSLRR